MLAAAHLLTTEEVARVLRVSTRTVYRSRYRSENRASWTLPSARRTTSWRHVPAHALSVFQR